MNVITYFLRSIGAIIAALVFTFLVTFFYVSFFSGIVSLFSHFSFTNWFRMDMIRAILFPIALGIIWAIGAGLCWLVKGKKWIAIPPILIFILGIIKAIGVLFLTPFPGITEEIGEGFLYYTGAILAFLAVLVTHIVCALGMFVGDD